MRNQTLFSGTNISAGAGPFFGSAVAVKPAAMPQSVMIPLEISCSSATPTVTVQGKLTEAAAWADLTSTVSGNFQLIPRCHFYRVGWANAAGTETLNVTVALL